MKIKKFEAGSMKEALDKVKAEMGADAFILATKQVSRKGPLGIGERKFLQVTAAIEEDGSAPEPAAAAAAAAEVADSTEPAEATPKPLLDIREDEEDAWREALKEPPSGGSGTYDAGGREAVSDSAASPFSAGFETVFADARQAAEKSGKRDEGGRPLRKELDDLKTMVTKLGEDKQDITPLQKELGELKSLLYSVVRNQTPSLGNAVPPQLVSWFQRLKDTGMDESVAAKLIQITEKKLSPEECAVRKKVDRFLQAAIRQSITVARISRGKGPHVAALVGPTGVGKTTTLAKLAAHAALQQKAKVALITLDTYRIAAVEQLKTYARIMDIPVQVALNLGELRSAIQFHQDKDLILIDTAGHSPRDQEAMTTLEAFLDGQDDIEVHLVLSATTKAGDLADIVAKFAPLEPAYLVFTKLDETSSYGQLFNQIIRTKKPVSYVTTGQNVPEDFDFASAEMLAALFVGHSLADAHAGSKQ